MIQPYKIFLVTLLIVVLPILNFAQQFNYTASLDTPGSNGFYTIAVSPLLSAKVKTDFSDIRVADENKQWIPHLLQYWQASTGDDFFSAFPIMQNIIADSGKNLLIIENNSNEGINNLRLMLKNAAVNRSAILSGSNNLQDWYIIDDKLFIGRSYENREDEYVQEINFPLAKYRYLKIIIDNNHHDPLLITKAGIYKSQGAKKIKIYQDNPLPSFVQNDSANYSVIEVKQDRNYQFDKIILTIGGSKFYSRNVTIHLAEYTQSQAVKPGIEIGSFQISSAMPAMFELPRTKAALFFIVIKNADNPPLKVEKVVIQQQVVSLAAYLEKGKKYSLLFDDPLATFANYDLQIFKDSIINMKQLNFGGLNAINNNASLKNAAKNNNQWIWPSIILAVIVLAFLTYQLTTDISKQKK